MNRKDFLKCIGAGAVGLAGLNPTQLLANGPSSPFEKKYGVWLGGRFGPPEVWKPKLERMQKAGINMLIPNVDDVDPEVLVPVAAEYGMEVHAWMVAMPRSNFVELHPEYYAVSRNGVSTAKKPPYVDYYTFLCPNRPEVQEWQAARARELAEIDGLTSVHLDYIRFPDVILPVALWPKYNLVQDKEYPEFDFCYCEVCRNLFKEQTGVDPIALGDDAPSNEAWVKFRWDSITRLVNRLSDEVHAHGKKLTAAVFPTPEIARKLVRQDWVNWKMDGLMPMMYHSFYNEPVSWIGEATRQGVEALQGKFPLYSGVYMPALRPSELAEATRLALDNGASGVVLFEGNMPTERHWNKLAAAINA